MSSKSTGEIGSDPLCVDSLVGEEFHDYPLDLSLLHPYEPLALLAAYTGLSEDFFDEILRDLI